MRFALCACCAVSLAALASGCSSSHQSHQSSGPLSPIGNAHSAHAGWLHEVRARAGLAPNVHYYNFPRSVLFAPLELLGIRYGFTVDKVHLIHLSPGQVAPDVQVRAAFPSRISGEIPTIMHSIDPIYRAALPNGTHARWEGFFFQANDEKGRPILGVFNERRGKNWGGGQFARSDALLPYGHG